MPSSSIPRATASASKATSAPSTGGAFDGMLAFSDDGLHYRVRETNEVAQIAGDTLFARWKPWSDVTVETWLIPATLAYPRAPDHDAAAAADHRRRFCHCPARFRGRYAVLSRRARPMLSARRISAAFSISARLYARDGLAQKAPPNTNLIVAKTFVPQLRGTDPGRRNHSSFRRARRARPRRRRRRLDEAAGTAPISMPCAR